MEKTKKLAALLMALLLALSAASCSSGDSEKQTDAAAGSQTIDTSDAVSSETESETEEEYQLPTADYDGYEFRILARVPMKSTWIIAAMNEVVSEAENGEAVNDAIFRRNSQTEERLNIKITHATGGVQDFNTGTTALKQILAGDDAFDIVYCNGSNIPSVVGTKGAVVDLNEVPGLKLDGEWWDQNSVSDLSIGGKLYCAAGDMNVITMSSVLALIFNKTIINDLSMEDPYTLVKEGTFTASKMYEMALAASADLDGNGVYDENDRFGYATYEGVVQTAMTESGSPLIIKDADDIPQMNLNTDRQNTVVELWQKIIHDEKSFYSYDYSSKVKDVPYELMSPMFVDNRILFYRQQLLGALNLREMDADYGIIPPPKLDESQDEYHCCVHYYWASFVMIPSTNSDLERCATIMNVFGSLSHEYVTPAFFDVTVSQKVARDDETIDMLKIVTGSRTYELERIFNWGNIEPQITQMEKTKKTDYSSLCASNEAKVQSAIDETLKLVL